MKKILVPTDFSEQAKYALEFAYQVAARTNGEIDLMHVVDYPPAASFSVMGEVTMDPNQDAYTLEVLKRVKNNLEEIANDEKYNLVTINTYAEMGNPYQNIAREIAGKDADLVVMGTQGASGLKEMFVGSNAEKMVRFAKCPVITVSDYFDVTSINSIVVAINPEDEQDEVLEEVKKFQKLFEAKLDLIWINTPHFIENEDRMREQLQSIAEKHGLENFQVHVYKSITPDSGVLFFAEEFGSSMIAMATHGRKGLSHLFSGSLAEDVVNHAKRPVLTYSLSPVAEPAKS